MLFEKRSPDGFEVLREKLLRAGIAPWRVRRYLTELADHLADLTAQEIAAGYDLGEAAMRARALLGDDEELAASWLTDPRLKSFTARAPWLVFAILPPFALIAGFVIPMTVLIVLAKLGGFLPGHGIAGRGLVRAAAIVLNLSVGPGVAALLAFIAWRQRLKPVWPLLATLLIVLLFFRFELTAQDAGRPAMMFTSFLAKTITGRPHVRLETVPVWQIAAQLLLSLTPMAGLWRHHRKMPVRPKVG